MPLLLFVINIAENPLRAETEERMSPLLSRSFQFRKLRRDVKSWGFLKHSVCKIYGGQIHTRVNKVSSGPRLQIVMKLLAFGNILLKH